MRELKKGSLYRHYKNRWYYVIDISIHSESREEFVTYFPLYTDELMLFVRPKEMFLEEIHVNSDLIQRERFLESQATNITAKEEQELKQRAEQMLKSVIKF